MEWWLFLILFLAGLMFLLALGMPVAFAFMVVNVIAAMLYIGVSTGPNMLQRQMFRSLATFTLAPIPFFIFMGELFFHSGIAQQSMKTLRLFMGKVPAREPLLAGMGGTLFSTLSGSTMANSAMLGAVLVPEMREKGYSKTITVGPIVAIGGLAMIIPPSALAVLLGSVAEINIGELLIGGILPGLLMAVLYGIYIVGLAVMRPEHDVDTEVPSTPLSTKIIAFLRDILPMGGVVFVVIGFIFLGIATPTESAALGAVATLLLIVYYGAFSYEVLRRALFETLRITGMVLLIIAGSIGFSQLLAITGASRGLVQVVVGLDLSMVMVLLLIQLVVLFLGAFMDQSAIIMLVSPMVMPIVNALGMDPIWFGIIFLLSLEIGLTSPPFGLLNFVMKSVVPDDITIGDIWLAALPFIVCDLIAMGLLIGFPSIITWLPNYM